MLRSYRDVLSAVTKACVATGLDGSRVPRMILHLDMLGYAGVKGFVARMCADGACAVPPVHIQVSESQSHICADFHGKSILYYIVDVLPQITKSLVRNTRATVHIRNTTDRLMLCSELSYIANQGYDVRAICGRQADCMVIHTPRYQDFPCIYTVADRMQTGDVEVSFSKQASLSQVPKTTKNVLTADVFSKRFNNAMLQGVAIDGETWEKLTQLGVWSPAYQQTQVV